MHVSVVSYRTMAPNSSHFELIMHAHIHKHIIFACWNGRRCIVCSGQYKCAFTIKLDEMCGMCVATNYFQCTLTMQAFIQCSGACKLLQSAAKQTQKRVKACTISSKMIINQFMEFILSMSATCQSSWWQSYAIDNIYIMIIMVTPCSCHLQHTNTAYVHVCICIHVHMCQLMQCMLQ